MRADRLVATLLLLQARSRLTASELAAELEISLRTARRDLEALAVAGVPVYSQPGRGGGWSLVGGARTDLSGLTAAEARALFLVAGPSAPASGEVRAALRKLIRALPEPLRTGAEAAADAVVVDATSWGQARRRPPAHLEVLQRAVVEGVQVRLGYAGRDRPPGERTVHPLGLVAKRDVWYLLAGTDNGRRTFRVDRVTSAEPTGEPAVRPGGFDLAAAWTDVSAKVERLRGALRVEANADPSVLSDLRWLFGVHLTVGEPRPDGRVEVAIGGDSLEQIASDLAGLGGRVKVVGPPQVREHLARIAAERAALYA